MGRTKKSQVKITKNDTSTSLSSLRKSIRIKTKQNNFKSKLQNITEKESEPVNSIKKHTVVSKKLSSQKIKQSSPQIIHKYKKANVSARGLKNNTKLNIKETKKFANNLLNNESKTTQSQFDPIVLIERMPLIENKILESKRVLRRRYKDVRYKDYSLCSPLIKKSNSVESKPLDVYEFNYDPTEEPQKKLESDSSGDENNSMKIELKKLRKKYRKNILKKQKNENVKNKKAGNKFNRLDLNQKKKQITNKQINIDNKNNEIKYKLPQEQTTEQNVEEQKTENTENQIQSEPVLQIIKKGTTQIESQDNVESTDQTPQINEYNNNDDDEIIFAEADDNNVEYVRAENRSFNIVEEVTRSFTEDLSDEEPQKINIISNIVTREADKKSKDKIFSSTINGKTPQPWRIDVTGIRTNPYVFSYKDKSFTPRYDAEKVKIIEDNSLKAKNENTDKNSNITKCYQTNILHFVNSDISKRIDNKFELFSDVSEKNTLKRKVLGEINFLQSTPIKRNVIPKSPNISFISPKKKSLENMFGFSYCLDESDKENIRQSPRKVKHTEILENIPRETSSNKKEKLDCVTPPAMDSDIANPLFQDLDEELHVSKKIVRQYARKQPKRKRLLTIDVVTSDEELEEVVPEKKKQKNGRTKKEEEEINKLASHYNSIFEEIEKFPLCIE